MKEMKRKGEMERGKMEILNEMLLVYESGKGKEIK